MFEAENPTRIWDTFAEPNNKTIPSKALTKTRPHPTPTCRGGPSTKNQVNGRRLRRMGSSKLVVMGFRNTLPDPVGFFLVVAHFGKKLGSCHKDTKALSFHFE